MPLCFIWHELLMFYCVLLPFFVLLKGNDFMLSDLISDLFTIFPWLSSRGYSSLMLPPEVLGESRRQIAASIVAS